MIMRTVLWFFLLAGLACQSRSADSPEGWAGSSRMFSDPQSYADALLDHGLQNGQAFPMLESLLLAAPSRLSGSQGYADACDWAEAKMRELGFDRVRREAVMVPHWVRGAPEEATLFTADGQQSGLAVCALGGSVGTPAEGIRAEVVEVSGLEALEALGEQVRGKIVFFNGPMEPIHRRTFHAYRGAVGQRSRGASEASKHGAVAALVRSMSTAQDDQPHTGSTRYAKDVEPIPAFALGVLSAQRLSEKLAAGAVQSVWLKASCETLPDVEQWNVIGELTGSELPDEYVVISGHLDAWDLGTGAHDDGGGCVQAIEAARLLRETGYTPRRTLRIIMYANEENGRRGGDRYAEQHAEEKHFYAFESDAGVFAPQGIALNLPEEVLERLRPLGIPLAAIGAERVYPNGGGVDIAPLKDRGIPVGSLRPADARYFDLHHSWNDTLEAVNPRELQLGAIVYAYWAGIMGNLEPAALLP